MSSSTCCFCLHPLPSNHRKRKKFHGESCLRAKSIIERLSDGKSYVELSDPHCFLCQSCEKQLVSISALERQLETIKEEVNTKLSRLHVSAEKRPGSVDIDAPSPKQSRQMSESSPAPVDVFIDTIHSDSAIHSPAPATIESPPVSSSLVQDTDPSPDIQVRNYNVISASKLTLFLDFRLLFHTNPQKAVHTPFTLLHGRGVSSGSPEKRTVPWRQLL